MLLFLLPFLGCLLVIMVDFCFDAFSLVPSQVIRSKNAPATKKSSKSALPNYLIPSQVIGKKGLQVSTQADADKTAAAEDINIPRRGRRRPKKKPKNPRQDGFRETDPFKDFPREGNLPDIYWRTIPMEHLRQHPRFEGLPAIVSHVETLEDARKFRQESWQWDVLHKGRCTTSQAVAALGFLEPIVGQQLKIPPSWWRGGRGAYARLREPSLREVHEMNKVLCNENNPFDVEEQEESTDESSVETEAPSDLWSLVEADNNSTHFVASYHYELTERENRTRRAQAQKLGNDENTSRSIRMKWGNTQESTALLTALNFFSKQDPGLTVKEVGMCGAGLDLNQTSIQSSLLVGATPDAVLSYSDGSIEVLEVKNHCPFLANRPRKKGKRSKVGKKFFVGDRSFEYEGNGNGVFSHYVPQLQLEMLCLGPECKSAVMVRQTATKGALVLRMHRHDKWIEEMIYWLHSFQTLYVEQNVPPPTDFFWNHPEKEERSRYRRFVSLTQQLKNDQVEIVTVIPSDEIQRSDCTTPLFLD